MSARPPDPPAAPTALTLEQAIEMALAENPELAAAFYREPIAAARERQAGRWPNPELEVEIEEIGAAAPASGFEAAETTVSLAQPIPLAGLTAKRRRLAATDTRSATARLDLDRYELVALVSQRFYELQLADLRVALAADEAELAASALDAVSRQVTAGKVSPLDRLRALSDEQTARAGLAAARRQRAAVERALTATWGAAGELHVEVATPAPAAAPPPPAAALELALGDSPRLHLVALAVERQRRAVELADTERWPELSVAAGYRHRRLDGGSSWLAGFSLSLPSIDRNQGERRAARLELLAQEKVAVGRRIELTGELLAARERMAAAVEELELLDDGALPAAAEAAGGVEISYREGKIGLLSLLDARRRLFELRRRRLDALGSYLTNRLLIERLIGRPLELPDDSEPTILPTDGSEDER